MSYIWKPKKGGKNHLIEEPSSSYTVCGKKIESGEIIDILPKHEALDLCHHCYAWVGVRMIVEWLGTDFFES